MSRELILEGRAERAEALVRKLRLTLRQLRPGLKDPIDQAVVDRALKETEI